jgi:serine/threonine protein kinase
LNQSNILVDEQGNARLADFGMVTVLFNSSTQATTVTGEGVGGTMRYMAPELHAASAAGSDGPTLSVTSDVYALAMTLWEVRPNISVSRSRV